MHKLPYPQFHTDVLKTLGRCMMEPDCWTDDNIAIGNILHRSNNNPNKVWCWWDASGDFSASMYLCLKYLPSALVQGWFNSVLAIPSPHWRAQIIVWLVGSQELLTGQQLWPSEFSIEAYPSISWEWSHCLRSELASSDNSGAIAVSSFIPQSSRELVLMLTQQHFTEDVYLSWLQSIYEIPYLELELGTIPSMFESIYV